MHDTFRDASKYREIERIRIETVDNALEVFADPLLEKVFAHLIGHTLANGENATFIRLSHAESGERLVIRIEDDGPGIALAEKPYLFDRGFGPGRRPEFCFAREILSITGISIAEAGISGRGTRFEIIVPEWAYRYATRPAPPGDLASGCPGQSRPAIPRSEHTQQASSTRPGRQVSPLRMAADRMMISRHVPIHSSWSGMNPEDRLPGSRESSDGRGRIDPEPGRRRLRKPEIRRVDESAEGDLWCD